MPTKKVMNNKTSKQYADAHPHGNDEWDDTKPQSVRVEIANITKPDLKEEIWDILDKHSCIVTDELGWACVKDLAHLIEIKALAIAIDKLKENNENTR